MGKESPAGVPGRRRVAGLRCLATMLFVLLVARCGGVEAGADIQGSAAPGRPNGILDKRQLVQKNFGFRPAPWWSDVTSAENGKDEQDGSDDGLSDGEPGATEPAYASRASKASKASKALKMKVLGAACNATVARPNGGCESGCCLGGKCVFCDLCGTPPPVGKSSPACRWCAAHGKALSEACLVRGDKCEFAKRTGRLADSACESGCCGVDGRCGFCDECRTCSYCRINGLLLNPDGLVWRGGVGDPLIRC